MIDNERTFCVFFLVILPDRSSFDKIENFLIDSINSEPRVQASVVRLAELAEKVCLFYSSTFVSSCFNQLSNTRFQEDFEHAKESNQVLFESLMEKYINNKIIQSSILKIIEISLKQVMRELLNKKSIDQLFSSNVYVNASFLQKFFLVFVVNIRNAVGKQKTV
jgi:hypothetical protein